MRFKVLHFDYLLICRSFIVLKLETGVPAESLTGRATNSHLTESITGITTRSGGGSGGGAASCGSRS